MRTSLDIKSKNALQVDGPRDGLNMETGHSLRNLTKAIPGKIESPLTHGNMSDKWKSLAAKST